MVTPLQEIGFTKRGNTYQNVTHVIMPISIIFCIQNKEIEKEEENAYKSDITKTESGKAVGDWECV